MSTENKKYSFPDPLESDEVKKTDAYGLKVAKAIGQDWFEGGFIGDKCDFSNRAKKIRENRLYSRGRQNTAGYKKLMEDLNYMNVDWTPPNIIGKFIDIVANGVRENLYRIDISAIDKIATLERKNYQEKLEKSMRTKSMLEKTKKILGIDLVPKGFIPEDKDELEMHMSMAYKPQIEVAEELLIKFVKATNNWKSIKEKVNRDLVENALGVVRCYTDKVNGIVLKYVDIENYIHSFVKDKDFSDKHYDGEVETITISELKRVSGFSDNTLRAIAKSYASLNGNNSFGATDFDRVDFSELINFKVSVLNFSYKTSKTIAYKKKFDKRGNFKMIEKNSDYNPPKRSDYAKAGKVLDTWYEGSYIIGSDYIYNYKECEILSRDKMNKALPPYITLASDIYENELHSLSERMQPTANQMYNINIKIQQLISQMRPDETEIDIDLLAELESKTGKKLTWEDAIGLYNSKGIVLSTRVNMGEDGIKDRPALRVPTQSPSGKLEQLTRAWIFHYNMLRDFTGINAARDGSQPSDVLVGVQQLQLEVSNTATKGVVEASLEISRKAAETISTRLGDIFRWGTDIADVYKNAVGATNLDIIDSLDNRHLHEFGFVIDILPTEKEMQEFKESLSIALQEGSIDVDDKIKAERIATMNIKQAENYLTYRRKKRMKEAAEQEDKRNQSLAQANAQSAAIAEEQRRKTAEFESMLKVKEARELAMIEILKQDELNKVNRDKEERGYEVDIFIEKLKKAGELSSKMKMEDRKDERTKLTATQQSKIAEQKSREGAGAIDFQTGQGMSNTRQYLNS